MGFSLPCKLKVNNNQSKEQMGSLVLSERGGIPLGASICSRCLLMLSTGGSRFRGVPSWGTHGPNQRAATRYQHTNAKSQKNSVGKPVHQIYPLKGYYSELLNAQSQPLNPSRTPQSQTTNSTSAKAAEATQSEPQKEQTPQEKFGIVFGTRLAGPGYSSTRYNPSASPKSAWRTINGVPIPPRPEEPDNCCMSGCVHCVWDDYRDDVEAWAQRINEAKKRDAPRRGGPRKKKAAGPRPLHDMRQNPRSEVDSASTSMDDDGGGSQGSWNADIPTEADADALFADIPVGIREFMKTEKKLKEKRKKTEDKA
ncbi:hypothetical protein MGYG_07324 [Nannizzia gypsea CBS 118893]|uniref:Oxidoreductase-like domain-containing protein n=1 Tax=Arthroderma gypseum (strain ATCC MYA-4604 / CBS 118893) TaxID=535722 RepID=E4V2U3_ARTGP|nr:hypothetical protein MGYG_07324 [Nannizzia gypsea CBS 118893]EFR04317.1 hypothetical protein MGYG_07324 [Nannizzia gypsea CBS 118893]